MICDLPVDVGLGGETNAQGDMSSPAGNDANTQQALKHGDIAGAC